MRLTIWSDFWNMTEGIVTQRSSRSVIKKKSVLPKVPEAKIPGQHHVEKTDHEVRSGPSPETSRINSHKCSVTDPELERCQKLPKEIGVMLITAGVVGLILPGPGTPTLLAGGLRYGPEHSVSSRHGSNSAIQ